LLAHTIRLLYLFIATSLPKCCVRRPMNPPWVARSEPGDEFVLEDVLSNGAVLVWGLVATPQIEGTCDCGSARRGWGGGQLEVNRRVRRMTNLFFAGVTLWRACSLMGRILYKPSSLKLLTSYRGTARLLRSGTLGRQTEVRGEDLTFR